MTFLVFKLSYTASSTNEKVNVVREDDFDVHNQTAPSTHVQRIVRGDSRDHPAIPAELNAKYHIGLRSPNIFRREHDPGVFVPWRADSSASDHAKARRRRETPSGIKAVAAFVAFVSQHQDRSSFAAVRITNESFQSTREEAERFSRRSASFQQTIANTFAPPGDNRCAIKSRPSTSSEAIDPIERAIGLAKTPTT